MTGFVIWAVLSTAAAALLVAWPLLRARHGTAPAERRTGAVASLLLILTGECPARLASHLLVGGLECRVILSEADFAAIDLQHHVASTAEDLRDLPIRQPADEGNGDDPEHGLGDFAHRAHHGAVTPAGVGDGAISL